MAYKLETFSEKYVDMPTYTSQSSLMNGFLNYDDRKGEKLVKTPTLPWLKKKLPFPPSKSRDTLDFRTLLAPKTQVLLEKWPFQPPASSHGLNPQERRRAAPLAMAACHCGKSPLFQEGKEPPVSHLIHLLGTRWTLRENTSRVSKKEPSFLF